MDDDFSNPTNWNITGDTLQTHNLVSTDTVSCQYLPFMLFIFQVIIWSLRLFVCCFMTMEKQK